MTARGAGFAEAQIPDMERRLANAIRIGTVAELNTEKKRIRVKVGKITTGWLRWSMGRSGPDNEWSPPEVGEQVILAAPSGDLAQAVAIGTIYRDEFEAPGSSADQTVRTWKDGAREEYNRETHTRSLIVPDGGKIVFTIGGTSYELTSSGAKLTAPQITFDTPVAHFTGKVTSDGDMIAQEVSLVHHKHGGVLSGPANTDEPVK